MFTISLEQVVAQESVQFNSEIRSTFGRILDGSVALDIRRRRDGCMLGAIVLLCLEITSSPTSRREGVDC